MSRSGFSQHFSASVNKRRAEFSEAIAQLGKQPHKMGRAKGEWVDGFFFQSQAEKRRYLDLKLMQTAKVIAELKPHPRFSIDIDGVHIMEVVPDFSYYDRSTGKLVVEDVKSESVGRDGKVKFTTNTALTKIGHRLMAAVLGIKVALVK